MSSGHRERGRELGAEELNKVLNDPALEEYLKPDFEVNTYYDMPYVAGYSKDGHVRYVDRDFHAPDEPVGRVLIGAKMVDVLPFLVGNPKAKDFVARAGHEGIEKAVLYALGVKYDYAHEIATAAERRLVMQAGHNWGQYQSAFDPFIKADEHKKLERMPPDYDMTPILAPPVNKKLVAAVHKAMGISDDNKKSKEEVDYGKGTTMSHCGNCAHFEQEGEHRCELVRGYITHENWCKLWESDEEL